MKKIVLLIGVLLVGVSVSGQTYTFTNAGAIGNLGPTQANVNTAYTATNLAGQVTVTSGIGSDGIQQWVVPSGGSYLIEATGASGGGVNAGMGAIMEGVFNLNGGDTLLIIVGQEGFDVLDGSASGGGGSFVVLSDPSSTTLTSLGRRVEPLIIAGGGGANPGVAHADCNANTTTAGNGGSGATGSGIGGVNGNGGGISVPSGNNRGGGGGGFLTDGERTGTCTNNGEESGFSFLNGGVGGLSTSCGSAQGPGGFGGGGASISTGWRSSGGGGGYSGGGGGQTNSIATTHRGGGGGSFNTGSSQNNSISTASGHGLVVITSLSACPSPSNPVATVIACDSIDLEWTDAADSSIAWLVPAGSPLTGGNLVIGDSSLNIMGTSANTSYDFYVANICGSDTSNPVGPISVNTGTTGAPIADFAASSPAFNTTVDFDASASTGDRTTFDWDFGDGNTGSGMIVSHSYAMGGTYNVELTVTNDCGVSDTTMTLANVDLDENALAGNLTIFPNPATNKVEVSFEASQGDDVTIRILDISGKEVLVDKSKSQYGRTARTLDLSQLAGGLYMLEVSSGSVKVQRRLVKQ